MAIHSTVILFVAVAGLFGCRGSSSNPPTTTTSVGEPAVTTTSALADAAKTLEGTWTCSGSVHGPGGASPSEVTVDVKPDLDKAWLRTDFVVLSGEYKYKFTSYRTFDAASSTWGNVIVDNMGGYARSSSTDGHIWLGESSGPMGEMKIKDTEDVVSPSMMNMRGQYSLDGRNWNTGYDLSCKK